MLLVELVEDGASDTCSHWIYYEVIFNSLIGLARRISARLHFSEEVSGSLLCSKVYTCSFQLIKTTTKIICVLELKLAILCSPGPRTSVGILSQFLEGG